MDAVKAFNNELQSLYEVKPPVSRAKMAQITKVAIKGIKFYKHIVQAVEKFIHKCRPEYKVPGLYVIDSIIRQSRHQFGIDKDVFAPRFTKNIVRTFQQLFQCSQEEKSKVVRVLNLWQKNGVFSPAVIQPLLDLAADPLNQDISTAAQKAIQDATGLVPSTVAAPPQKSATEAALVKKVPDSSVDSGKGPANDDDEEADDGNVLEAVAQLLQQSQQPSDSLSLSAQQQQLEQLQLLQQQLMQQQDQLMNTTESAAATQAPDQDAPPLIDASLLGQIQSLTHQLLTRTKDETAPPEPPQPPPSFNKKLLDFDYGESDDEEEKREPGQPPAPPLPPAAASLPSNVQSLLSDPSIMKHLHEMSETLQKTEQLKTELSLQEVRQKLLEQQQEEFQQQIKQLQPFPPEPEDSSSVGFPDDDRDDRSSHRSSKRRRRSKEKSPLRSRSRTPKKKRKRSRSRSRDRRRRSRSKDRHRRSRSRSKDRERRKHERARRANCLPVIMDNHVSVCSTTIWVGHLSKITTEDSLQEEMQEHGEVLSLKFVPPRGCAYVCLSSRRDASRAIDKLKLKRLLGNTLKSAWATNSGIKDSQFKRLWDVELGVTYIPWGHLPDNLEELAEGGIIDEDSLPPHLKGKPLTSISSLGQNDVSVESVDSVSATGDAVNSQASPSVAAAAGVSTSAPVGVPPVASNTVTSLSMASAIMNPALLPGMMSMMATGMPMVPPPPMMFPSMPPVGVPPPALPAMMGLNQPAMSTAVPPPMLPPPQTIPPPIPQSSAASAPPLPPPPSNAIPGLDLNHQPPRQDMMTTPSSDLSSKMPPLPPGNSPHTPSATPTQVSTPSAHISASPGVLPVSAQTPHTMSNTPATSSPFRAPPEFDPSKPPPFMMNTNEKQADKSPRSSLFGSGGTELPSLRPRQSSPEPTAPVVKSKGINIVLGNISLQQRIQQGEQERSGETDTNLRKSEGDQYDQEDITVDMDIETSAPTPVAGRRQGSRFSDAAFSTNSGHAWSDKQETLSPNRPPRSVNMEGSFRSPPNQGNFMGPGQTNQQSGFIGGRTATPAEGPNTDMHQNQSGPNRNLQFNKPPPGFSNQGNMGGPPSSMGGPPANMGGPLGNMAGPPGNMGGPPGNMGGPPGNMGGPPGSIGGPPGSMGGTQGNIGRPPGSMGGPPGSMGGPPGNIGRPHGNMGGPRMNWDGPPMNQNQNVNDVRPSFNQFRPNMNADLNQGPRFNQGLPGPNQGGAGLSPNPGSLGVNQRPPGNQSGIRMGQGGSSLNQGGPRMGPSLSPGGPNIGPGPRGLDMNKFSSLLSKGGVNIEMGGPRVPGTNPEKPMGINIGPHGVRLPVPNVDGPREPNDGQRSGWNDRSGPQGRQFDSDRNTGMPGRNMEANIQPLMGNYSDEGRGPFMGGNNRSSDKFSPDKNNRFGQQRGRMQFEDRGRGEGRSDAGSYGGRNRGGRDYGHYNDREDRRGGRYGRREDSYDDRGRSRERQRERDNDRDSGRDRERNRYGYDRHGNRDNRDSRGGSRDRSSRSDSYDRRNTSEKDPFGRDMPRIYDNEGNKISSQSSSDKPPEQPIESSESTVGNEKIPDNFNESLGSESLQTPDTQTETVSEDMAVPPTLPSELNLQDVSQESQRVVTPTVKEFITATDPPVDTLPDQNHEKPVNMEDCLVSNDGMTGTHPDFAISESAPPCHDEAISSNEGLIMEAHADVYDQMAPVEPNSDVCDASFSETNATVSQNEALLQSEINTETVNTECDLLTSDTGELPEVPSTESTG